MSEAGRSAGVAAAWAGGVAAAGPGLAAASWARAAGGMEHASAAAMAATMIDDLRSGNAIGPLPIVAGGRARNDKKLKTYRRWKRTGARPLPMLVAVRPARAPPSSPAAAARPRWPLFRPPPARPPPLRPS